MRGALVSVLIAVAALPAHAGPLRTDAVAVEQYDAATRAFEDGDFQKAIELVTQSILRTPSAKAHLLRGNVYVKLGQLDDARADYEKFLQLEKSQKLRAPVQKLLKDLASASRARLAIASQPPGATVFLDLKAEGPKGKTPVTLPVSVGRHRVMLELDGYEPFVQKDVVAIDNQEVAVSAKLVVRGCDLRLTTTPPSAEVLLDGGAPESAPILRRLPPGNHQVVVRASGFEPRTQTFGCAVGAPVALDVALEASRATRLDVRAPAGATITVDGKPFTGGELASGNHTLDVAIAAPTQAAPQKSVARSWWLWTTIGIVLAGAAIGTGLGVGLANRGSRIDVIHVLP